MTDFQREVRYTVIKHKDVRHLNVVDQKELVRILDRLNTIRADRGKKEITCVVVEDDWPEYQLVWGLLHYGHTIRREPK